MSIRLRFQHNRLFLLFCIGVLTLITFLCVRPSIVQSQGFYLFGRNKIQYMDFNWHILETEHFQIYFYPEMKILAERGAKFAEEAYSELSRKFNSEIDRKIPLIFYSSHLHFEQTNITPGFIPEGVGGFFEFLKGRVVVPSDGSITHFRRVIRHELVHVFTHNVVSRKSKDHNKFFSGGVPLWFTEGLAECWSGPWDGQSEMVIRDAVISGYLVPFSEIRRIEGSYLMYKEGENFLRFIEKQYGSEKLLLFLEHVWKGKKFYEVVEDVLGKPFSTIDEEWFYHLKKKYYPLMENEDIPSMAAERITQEGYNSKPAYYEADGEKYVVFISNRVGYTNIYMKPLSNGITTDDLEILVKGERTPEFESFHVFRSKIDVNSSGELAFVSKRGGQDALNIYNIPQRKLLKSYDFKDVVSFASPSWSPDGNVLVITGINKAGNRDIYLLYPDDGSLVQITNDYYDDRDPTWHPNGRYITFSSDRSAYGPEGEYNIFTLDFQERNIVRLTSGKHSDYTPAWSPDGKYLAFTSDRAGATNVWIMESKLPVEMSPKLLASSSPRKVSSAQSSDLIVSSDIYKDTVSPVKQLTSFISGVFDPEWTPDGGLLFSSFEKFNFQIQKVTNILGEDFSKGFDDSTYSDPGDYQAWSPERIDMRERPDSRQYKKKYNLDVMLGQIAQHPQFGTAGGSIFSFSDMLGNDYFTLLLFNSAQRSTDFTNSFNVVLTRYVQGNRTNLVYGLYNLDYRWYNSFDGFYDKAEYGGFVGIQYPFSSFSRFQATLNFSHQYNEYFEALKNTRQALLFSSFVSYVKDNSLWVQTGPIDGQRYTFTLGQTTDLQFNNISYYTVAFDYRHYFRLSLRSAYAIRLMTIYRHGKDPERLFMGGSWDLRGYRRFSIWGQKLSLISQELRFPLLDQFSLGFPKMAIRFNRIRGALFLDAGNAWDSDFDEVLGSIGGGIRFNIGFIVLRLDIGKKIEKNFSKLSKDIFTQFFFGWDF